MPRLMVAFWDRLPIWASFLIFAIMCLPAIVNAILVARTTGHQRTVDYDTYTYRLRTLVMLIFVAAQAPEMVSRDLRSHVLPLYLSRPLRRLDYPLAKYAAFSAACLLVIEFLAVEPRARPGRGPEPLAVPAVAS